MRSFHHVCLGLILAGLVGCGAGNSVEVVRVTGRVTLDEQPLEKGLIQFLPTDGKGSSAASEIKQGEYQAEVPVGNKRVEITSPKVIGQKKAYDTPDSPVMDLLEERIPLEYNGQSQLKANVSRELKTFDFTLKSKPAP
ncbi:MAG: hypothetical protein ACKV2Q_22665 [Planctomycetaceae bacterium]